jgi:EAL domain-containing protein (putative c-di-GMP-specific phosphodiesterase class I)/GGDEF domain-containing protein
MDADVVATVSTGTRPDHAPQRGIAGPLGTHDLEPPLLAALTVGGVALAWATGAGRGAWTAVGTVGVLAASAWLARIRDPRPPAFGLRASRAALALAAAAVAVGVGQRQPAALLAWFPAVCAVYALVFTAGAAAAFTTAALGVLVLLAADSAAGAPSETAFAACAAALLAVSLAARTLRAALGAFVDARRAAAEREPAPVPASAPDVVVPAPASPVFSPVFLAPPAGLPGRDGLLAALAQARSRAGVVGGDTALLVLTLRGADTLASSVGPGRARDVLDTVARRARAWLPAGDVVAWLPDGRLAVLLEGVDAGTCVVVARRLAALLAEPVDAGSQVVSLPATAALALADGPHDSPEALLARAEVTPPLDDADVVVPATSSGVPVADGLAAELWPALAAGEVGIALQPIVALGTLPRHDRTIAVEALARWTRADGTSVPPARLVPAARRSGLADLLAATVLAQGLDAVRARRTAGDATLGLAVNLAPEQLTGPGAATTLLRALDAAGVEPSALTVEIPAASAFDDPTAARAALAALRDAGVGVALDNFGTAGLSISALRDLPLTGVKLDRALTADLGVDDRLVVATVRLTTRLGLTCTAVGVETRTQLDAARSLGIDAVQGHLLGRPERPLAATVTTTVAAALATTTGAVGIARA